MLSELLNLILAPGQTIASLLARKPDDDDAEGAGVTAPINPAPPADSVKAGNDWLR